MWTWLSVASLERWTVGSVVSLGCGIYMNGIQFVEAIMS